MRCREEGDDDEEGEKDELGADEAGKDENGDACEEEDNIEGLPQEG